MLRHVKGEHSGTTRRTSLIGDDDKSSDGEPPTPIGSTPIPLSTTPGLASEPLSGGDDDDFNTMDVIFFTVKDGSSTRLRKLGTITLPLQIPLVDARSLVGAQLNVALRRAAGWRFVVFRRKSFDEPGSSPLDSSAAAAGSLTSNAHGAYHVVTDAEEIILTVRHALTESSEGVPRGLYVSMISHGLEEQEESVEDGFLCVCMEGRVDRMREYLNAGVRVDAQDDVGRTGLHLAAMHHRLGVALALLREYGMSPDCIDHLHRTPLHIAAQVGDSRMCEVLLEANASTAIPDHLGRLPEVLAKEANQRDVVLMLHSADAESVV